MFARKKKNKSGVISVQIIDKSSRKYKVIRTIGSSANEKEVNKLFFEAKQWILKNKSAKEIDFTQSDIKVEDFFNSIESLRLAGIDVLLGRLFDEIGFNVIKDPIFKQLYCIVWYIQPVN